MMENKRVLAIIFDLDNTLVDTAGAGRVAIQKVNENINKSKYTSIFSFKVFHALSNLATLI